MSIGGASVSGEDAGNARALLQRADEALYRAKAQGRNCVCAAWSYGDS